MDNKNTPSTSSLHVVKDEQPAPTNLEQAEPVNEFGLKFDEWRNLFAQAYVERNPGKEVKIDTDAAFRVFEAGIGPDIAASVLTTGATLGQEQYVRQMINAMIAEAPVSTTRSAYHELFLTGLELNGYTGQLPSGLIDYYWRKMPDATAAVRSFCIYGPPPDFAPPAHEELASDMVASARKKWGEMPSHVSDSYVVALSQQLVREGSGSAALAVGIERLFKEVMLAFQAGMEYSTGTDRSAALLEEAWGIIANVSGGNWAEQGSEWKKAAEQWRDKWARGLHAPHGMFDAEARLEQAMKDPAYWMCTIGPVERDQLPEGADGPLRSAVSLAIKKLIDQQPVVLSTGWGLSNVSYRRVTHARFGVTNQAPKLNFPTVDQDV